MSRVRKLGRIGRYARANPARRIRSTRRNPSGVRIVYNRLLGGWYIVRGPHQTPLGGRFDSKEQAQQHLIDQQNARDQRFSYLPGRRNPVRRIRSSAGTSTMRHLRGSARDVGSRWPGIAAHYHVQVKRSAQWITLATFGNNLNGKARATEYGKLLARRYPRQQFRVFWPDGEKNPAHRARRVRRKKNPAPRDSVRGGAKVDAAARLYAQFTGHKVGRARQVTLPAHAAGLAIGPVLGVAYETTRDGKREKYLHDFRRGARPTLAASFDGRQLYLLGGAYRFTERGIVDR